MKDPMLDEDFLKELDHFKHKFLWAKIISLNFEEYPQQEIIGKVTSGSINIDGNSSVRRTCSLSLVANEVDINDFYWSLNTKFKVEIGLENWINPEYPDIIWFKQGTFLISTFNCSVGVNNYTISIQGKDKMVLLNGEVGGVVPASWDFGKIDVTNPDGSITQDFYPIKDIVYQAVHEYAQEPWQNIIINDLDDYGIELLEYTGSTPLYYIIESSGHNDSREVYNMTCDDMECEIRADTWGWYEENDEEKIGRKQGTEWISTTFSQIENHSFTVDADVPGAAGQQHHYCYEKLMEQLDPSGNVTESPEYLPAMVRLSGNSSSTYTIAKITSDNGFQVCGYRVCDIVYPYDLIASPGESLTSVFDKLVKMLGNFEYFYDVEGRFVFQKKKIYADVSYNNIINEHSISSEVWAESSAFSSKYSYTFGKSELLSSIQNNPNLSNLKNDFSLWGERDQGDIKVPIHMRYAIDHKPYWYKVIGHHIQRDSNGLAFRYVKDEKGNKTGEKEYLQEFDTDGKTIIALSTNYEYDDAGKIYCTDEGWNEYQKRLNEYVKEQEKEELSTEEKAISKLVKMREEYPVLLRGENSAFRDWWKLSDWAALYEEITESQIPDDVRMGYGEKTILDNTYYANWTDMQEIFNNDYGLSALDKINVIDVDERNMSVTYFGHGKGCSHYYSQLLEKSYIGDRDRRENSETWIYDPRIWDRSKIREESNSIWNEEIANELYGTIDKSQVNIVDWREIIYQMANDYRRHYREEDFLIKVRENNMITPYDSWYQKGYTGYEKYYIDFEMNLSQGVVAYWRELYNPAAAGQTGRYLPNGNFESDTDTNLVPEWKSKDEEDNPVVYQKNNRVSYDGEIYRSTADNNTTTPGGLKSNWIISHGDFTYDSEGWNPDILNNPEALNFWFDFLDTTGELNKYTVSNIGQRSKATNDTTIKAIYFRETPNVIFYTSPEENMKLNNWRKPGYCYMHVPEGLDNLFSISSRGKNSMDVISEYLYTYTYPASAITLNSIPIYYLTPNTLIYVEDKDTGAIGEYIIQKYSIQLGLSAQMTINAVETPKRLY